MRIHGMYRTNYDAKACVDSNTEPSKALDPLNDHKPGLALSDAQIYGISNQY